MLKKYRISVDGKSYEVEVQDIGTGSSADTRNVPAAPAATGTIPETAPTAAVASSAAPETAAVKPIAVPTDIKGEAMRAPMPGTILSVTASVGQVVKRGEVLLVLEAMKMENEIVAHIDGTISAIYVQKGSTVNAGDPMVAFA